MNSGNIKTAAGSFLSGSISRVQIRILRDLKNTAMQMTIDFRPIINGISSATRLGEAIIFPDI